MLADFRHPDLLADRPGRALLLHLLHRARAVALPAGAGIALPAAGLTDAAGDHRTGNLTGFGLPAAAANLHGLHVLDRLAHRPADILRAGLPDRLAHRVGNLLRPRLVDGLADGVGLLPLLVHRPADRVGDLLRAGLVDRLAHRVGLLTGLIHRLAHRVRDLLRAGLVDRLAHRVGLLTGLIHRLAHRVRDLLRAGLVDRLAHRVGDLASPRLVDRLADGVGLLPLLIDRPADRVGDLLRAGLVDRLADRVGNRPGASFPHRLADRVLNLLATPLRLIADAVDFSLLDHLLADGLVAGVFLLLVNDILDHARAAARRGCCTRRVTRRFVPCTALSGLGEADGRHLARGPLVAGETAIRCIDSGC